MIRILAFAVVVVAGCQSPDSHEGRDGGRSEENREAAAATEAEGEATAAGDAVHEDGDSGPGPAAKGATSRETGSAPDEPEPAEPRLAGKIEAGDSLSKILRRVGLDGPAVYRTSVALQTVTDPAALRLGQPYRIELDDNGKLARLDLALDAVRTAVVERTEGGLLEARIEAAETDTRVVDLGLRIETSLWAAMEKAGIEPSLIDRVADVFAYDINFYTDTRPKDTIRVIVERVELDGKLVRWGQVHAAEYAGQLGTRRVYWWAPRRGEPRYVDHEGRGVSRTLLKTPLRFARVSSAFNPRRMHPVLHRVKGHNGTDYAAPTGTPIMAAAPGKIVFRGKKGGAGNMVIVAHAGGMKTLYMHMSRFAGGQSVGQRVRAKQTIGYVGATGLATGPHLHFGVTVRGRYIDPQKIKQHRGTGVGNAERGRWKRQRKKAAQRLADLVVPRYAVPLFVHL